MGFFKATKTEEAVKENTGGKYLTNSGIYDVHIIAPFVDVNDKGARTVNFFIEHAGQEQPLYGNLRLDNNDGSPNFGADIFNKFLVVADVDEVEDPIEGELPIGKGGDMKDVAILDSLTDLDVKIRVQMEYSVYKDNIQEKKVIKNFYRAEDGASAEEIVKGDEPGTQLEKDMKYADNVTYKDGLDEDQVKAWIEAKRPKGTAGSTATATKKPSFGKRKFGK